MCKQNEADKKKSADVIKYVIVLNKINPPGFYLEKKRWLALVYPTTKDKIGSHP